MRTKSLITVWLFTIAPQVYSQPCSCTEEFSFLVNHIETNYAGFSDKVNDKTRTEYHEITENARTKATTVNKAAYCVFLMNEWLRFFNDGHIQIRGKILSNNTEASSENLTIETITILEEDMTRLEHGQGSSIEGIYWSPDSAYRIALVSHENNFREYAGVVLNTNVPDWAAGQVKLELKQTARDTLEGIVYVDDHTPRSIILSVLPDALGDWQREGARRVATEPKRDQDVTSWLLSPQTFYVRIGSFNQRNAEKVDSLLHINQSVLHKTPNLILDLRDNGGGSDFVYEPLLPYLYTGPIISSGADVLATDANMTGWDFLLSMPDIPADEKERIKKIIDDMQQHPGELVPMDDDETKTFDRIEPYPQRVVVLMNERSGSTTEQFLLCALQSKKVTLMGDNSAGVLDYANMRFVNFKSMPYALFYATTRSRRIDEGKGIDNTGIEPHIKLTPSQDWIQEAQQYLEKREPK